MNNISGMNISSPSQPFGNNDVEQKKSLASSFKAKISSFKSSLGSTEGKKSGGLFIVEGQSHLEKASAGTRVAHFFLAAIKSSIGALFAALAYIPAQTFLLPVFFTGIVAIAFGANEFGVAIAGVGASPTLLMMLLAKSVYHDLKLTATGKA